MRWRQIKSYFSRRLPKFEKRSPSRQAKCERAIWQRRFWEHAICDDEDYMNHVDYIQFNPVKYGYVNHPIDWPFSSIHRFVNDGVLDAHWGTSGLNIDLDVE